jgi:hypothetical protein
LLGLIINKIGELLRKTADIKKPQQYKLLGLHLF